MTFDECQQRVAGVCLKLGIEHDDMFPHIYTVKVHEPKTTLTKALEIIIETECVLVYWEVWETGFIESKDTDKPEQSKCFNFPHELGAAILLIHSLAEEYNIRALTAHHRGE